MPLSKLVFKPGINREGTNYSNEGGWHDGDKIRFRYGYVEKLGGWERVNQTAYQGTPRFVHDFVTLASESLLFIGTEKKAYLEESGTLYDITPFRRTVALPYSVTGEDAGGFVGTVVVSIGGPEENIAEVKGVAATGVAGLLDTLTVVNDPDFEVGEMEGQVGTVQVFTPGDGDITVLLRPRSTTVSEFSSAMVSSVGTVTVTAIRNS